MSVGTAAKTWTRDMRLIATETPQHPLLLTPTVVIALDDQGRRICERLASLLRAHVRDADPVQATAIRDRFGFIRLEGTYPRTEVQAIRVDPSERLWNIAAQSWSYSSFTTEPPVAFGVALQEAIRRVLNYRLVAEDLRDRNIIVQPSHLNIFFAGALIPSVPEVVASLQSDADSSSAVQTLSDAVVHGLDDIERIANAVCDYADESASLDLVVRGAFLSLTLPEDSFTTIRDTLAPHGTKLGRLLSPRMEGEREGLRGYREPRLHFCSLYANHDDDGAWYDGDQLTNMVAGAIYAVMQSELLSNNLCATQLGLRDPYAGPYERIATISATRSAPPSADLLDYAALHYGAYLLSELLPQASRVLTARERMAVKPIVETLLAQPDLLALTRRDHEHLIDGRGLPTQLSRLAIDAAYPPPDLWQLVPEPRLAGLARWTRHVDRTLERLSHVEQLSKLLDQPLVEADDTLPQRPDGRQLLGYEVGLLRDWHRWRRAVESVIDAPETGEASRRVNALISELDRGLWGQVPDGIALSGPRYCMVVLELAHELLSDVQRQFDLPAELEPPSDQALLDEITRARVGSSTRAHIAPIVAMTSTFFVLLTYLFTAISQSGATDRFVTLLRQPGWTIDLPLASTWRILIPTAGIVAAAAALALLLIALLTRHWQTRRALRGLREYARLVRRHFAVQLYREEHAQLQRLIQKIQDHRRFLQRYLQGLDDAIHGAPERNEAGAADLLRGRAEAIGHYGFRDLSEYVPMARGGPIAIYNDQIAPRMPTHRAEDVPRLRRYAQELCSFRAAQMSDDEIAIRDAARATINTLVLGDEQVSERDPHARLRHIAYNTLRSDLEEITLQTMTQQILQRALDLQKRTHLMLRTGYRQDLTAYPQDYLVAALVDVGEAPSLAETILVRGFDRECVMYVRVMSGVWPTLFDGGRVVLK